jgi:hypothetical protein
MLHPEASEAGGDFTPTPGARIGRYRLPVLIRPPGRYHALMMHVDDVVEVIFHRLCFHEQDSPPGADRSMAFTELRLALGITEAQLNEALWVLSFPGDHRIELPAKDRIALGKDWRGGASGRHPGNLG